MTAAVSLHVVILRSVYGRTLLLPSLSLQPTQVRNASVRLLLLATAWITLMAGISLVGPARESLSLDATLIDRNVVPYLIMLSSIVTVALNWLLPKTQTVTQTLRFGTWMTFFFGLLLVSCQSKSNNSFVATTFSSMPIKAMSVGSFFVATSCFAIFPVSVLWSELPETLLNIGIESDVLPSNVTLERQSYTFFGLCFSSGHLGNSDSSFL